MRWVIDLDLLAHGVVLMSSRSWAIEDDLLDLELDPGRGLGAIEDDLLDLELDPGRGLGAIEDDLLDLELDPGRGLGAVEDDLLDLELDRYGGGLDLHGDGLLLPGALGDGLDRLLR